MKSRTSVAILCILIIFLCIAYRVSVNLVDPLSHTAVGVITDISVRREFLGTTYWFNISGIKDLTLASLYMPSLANDTADTLTDLQVGDKVTIRYYRFFSINDVIKIKIIGTPID